MGRMSLPLAGRVEYYISESIMWQPLNNERPTLRRTPREEDKARILQPSARLQERAKLVSRNIPSSSLYYNTDCPTLGAAPKLSLQRIMLFQLQDSSTRHDSTPPLVFQYPSLNRP
jgi:hypothetical protein